MTNAVSAAECALYAVLVLPVLFLIVRHGIHGFTGWFFLSLFCVLRIVGGGMSVDDSKPSASIISNVGLSPILLAAAGILHEARLYRIHNINQKAEWAFALLYHFPVVVGVALTAVGSSKLQSRDPSTDMEHADKLVKAGMAILTVTWAILVVWTALSFTAARARNAEKVRAGTVLLWSIAFSLVFIGIRVFYSLVTLTTRKAYLNPTTGALPIRVVLGFLPELIATIAFVAAGLSTQGASKLASEDGSDDYTMPHKPQSAPWV